MLQKIPKQFQGSPIFVGRSTQHERDIETICWTVEQSVGAEGRNAYVTTHPALSCIDRSGQETATGNRS
jgi:hypothetical protein